MTYIHKELTNVSVIPSHTSSITLCIKESLTMASSEEGTVRKARSILELVFDK
jgi:hypothetical protein